MTPAPRSSRRKTARMGSMPSLGGRGMIFWRVRITVPFCPRHDFFHDSRSNKIFGERPMQSKLTTQRPPKPPKHLSREAAAWWRTTCAAYDLDEHHLKLLRLACETWDRAQAAREALATHGTIYTDRFGQPRARPELGIERDSRVAFARLVRELGFDDETPDTPRPPRINGRYMR